jgi:SsrA-binding protein
VSLAGRTTLSTQQPANDDSRRTPATSKKQKKKASAGADPNERPIAQNRKAWHNYTVLDTLECGIALVGSEVKSLRQGKVSLAEAYARVRDGEVWLVGCDIAEYVEANRFNHVPRRPRKLLLHRREIHRFAARAYEQGLTLVPLKMYFKRGRAKVLMGICRGRGHRDKREAMKKAEAHREMQRQVYRR